MNKKKDFYICPRISSYGALLNTIAVAFSVAESLNINIKIIEILNDPKFFFLRQQNINKKKYRLLIHKNVKIIRSGVSIKIKKTHIILIKLIKKYKFISFIFKTFFFLANLNIKTSKDKFYKFLNFHDFYNLTRNEKDCSYLNQIGLNTNKSSLQKMYLERSPLNFNYKVDDLIKNLVDKYNFITEKNFTCLYVREKYSKIFQYLKKKRMKCFYNQNDFERVFNFLKQKNYGMVRLSSRFSENYDFEYQNFLDLRKANIFCEEYEYFLSKNCDYFISTGGGKSELARIFKKPILQIDTEYNVLHNFNFSTIYDQIIIPHIYSIKEKKFLSLKDQFQQLNSIFPYFVKAENLSIIDIFNHDDYLVVKNTSEEILDLVKNYTNNLEKVSSLRKGQTELFEIKTKFLEKKFPKYYLNSLDIYPENPIISEPFFLTNYDYSEQLNKKTFDFNKKYNY